MGYRDDELALDERGESVREDLEIVRAEVEKLEAEIAERRAANLPVPARRWPLVVGGACILVISAVVWWTYGDAKRRADELETRRADLLAEERHAVSVLEDKRRAGRKILAGLSADAAAPSDKTATLFDAISGLDCTDEQQAWFIVGAAACGLRDAASREAARKALRADERQRLDDLCAEAGVP